MLTSDEASREAGSERIAVVGMAGRFPGARNIEQLWHNLRNGIESVVEYSDEQLDDAGVPLELRSRTDYVRRGAILEEPAHFDASFFGLTPREAEAMDPQQRVFLECCWEVLETAGYDPERYEGLVGVFAGAGINTYMGNNLLANPEALRALGGYQVMLLNEADYLTTRVSYSFNLRGPSVSVKTACSTSLVAINLACDALLDYRCDMALAGGVAIWFPQAAGYLYEPGMILSPDGHCRAFDAGAKGTIRGDGAAVVALKRLSDALADGDNILAVVRGWAVNNDGSGKIGFTAPSIDGQAEAIADALAMSEVDPDTVGYVEAHGTGTELGDPIEVSALNLAYGLGSASRPECALGSLKTNIGHLDAAAGAAGFIKTVLMLQHGELPPSLHFEEPNPAIPFNEGPFRVNAHLRKWETAGTPRRAGVSSFGMGGTNAHTILEQAPQTAGSGEPRSRQLLVLSAKTDSALERLTDNLADYLEGNPGVNLADVAWTLQVGRNRMPHRRNLACKDVQEGVTVLRGRDPKRLFSGVEDRRNRPCAFLFTGQGSQYAGMGRALYEEEPLFRGHIDAACEALRPALGLDLRKALYPEAGGEADSNELLKHTRVTQPALFVLEYALAQLWMSWGLTPDAMVGHSIGEYVAACLSGVFSLEDGLRLIAARGALMDEMPGGSMLAVQLPDDELKALLGEHVSMAAVNAPSFCVVSGPGPAVSDLERDLSNRGVTCRPLKTSHAFHSSMMEPAAAALERALISVDLKPPKIPFISNVTGTWITPEQATSPAYWKTHLLSPVRFSDAVPRLLENPDRVLLEVGPGNSLVSLAKQQGEIAHGRTILQSLPHPRDPEGNALSTMLDTLGRLWSAGTPVDWSGFHTGERRTRIPLPTYPFERERFWVEPKGGRAPVTVGATKPARAEDLADWFYVPSWKQSVPPPRPVPQNGNEEPSWIIFDEGQGVGARAADLLRAEQRHATLVLPGTSFEKVDEGQYTIRPENPGDYSALLDQLEVSVGAPQRILHLWSLLPSGSAEPAERFERVQEQGLYSLLHLTRTLEDKGVEGPVDIGVVGRGLHRVLPGEDVDPACTPILGACLVISQELPGVRCASIDVRPGTEGDGDEAEILAERVTREILTGLRDPVVVYRGRHRWARTFDSRTQGPEVSGSPLLRPGGTYLVTGGLGRVGLALSERLAREPDTRLILVSLSGLPGRESWPELLRDEASDAALVKRIRRVMRMEEHGAEVMVAQADVGKAEMLRDVVDRAVARFGRIDGVIHAAGWEPTFREIRELTPEDFHASLTSRVVALDALQQALQGREPRFVLLNSSLSSVLGGLGLATHASANCIADAFAMSQNGKGGACWISIGWDTWAPDDEGARLDSQWALAIEPEAGAEATARVLAMDPPSSVVISTWDLAARLDQWVSRDVAEDSPSPKHARPESGAAHVESADDVERAIVDIWEDLLGITGLSASDDFFELGGNSLMAVRVVSRLHESFEVSLPIQSVFEATTIADLAERVRTIMWMTEGQEQDDGSVGDREELVF